MNWRRLYATVQIWIVILLMAFANSCFYSVIVTGIFRAAIGLDEIPALIWVGVPSFIVLFIVHIRFLPKPLRKTGMLSDEPEKFGPWFEN